MISPVPKTELCELEIDVTTYTILVTHSVVSQESIAFLLEFLLMVDVYLTAAVESMSEESVDKYYIKIFETHAIHKYLNYQLSQFDTISEWQSVVNSFFIGLNNREPRLLEALQKFACTEEIFSETKKMKIVISRDSEEILKHLFQQDSALLRIGMSGSLILAAQIYNRLARFHTAQFSTRDLFYFYLGQENN